MSQVLKNDENGNVMVVVLLLLVVATISAITLSNDSIIEMQIASNTQFYAMTFHFADSGINVTPMLIEAFYSEDFTGDDMTGVSVTYAGGTDDTLFKNEALAMEIDTDTTASMEFVMDDDYTVTNQMTFRDRKQAVGSESGTSFYFYYNLAANATGPRNSQSTVSAAYRHVLN